MRGRTGAAEAAGASAGITGPDQHRAVLIDGEALALDEFVFQVVQGGVIELELPLERAIGQAAPLAQQGDHLIHHRDKVHPVSSLPGARPPCSCDEFIIA